MKIVQRYLTPKGYRVELVELGFVDVVSVLCPDGEYITTAFDCQSFAASAYTEAIDFYS